MGRPKNLLLFGPSGVGKIQLALGISLSLIALDRSARFFSATTLIKQLQHAKGYGYVRKDETEASLLFERGWTATNASLCLWTTEQSTRSTARATAGSGQCVLRPDRAMPSIGSSSCPLGSGDGRQARAVPIGYWHAARGLSANRAGRPLSVRFQEKCRG